MLYFRFLVNFGSQQPPWKPTPPGFTWVDHVPFKDKVLGLQAPPRKQDCEANVYLRNIFIFNNYTDHIFYCMFFFSSDVDDGWFAWSW